MLRGFYAICDRPDDALAYALLAARPCAVQLRIKPKQGPAPALRDLEAFGARLRTRCHAAGVLFVVNDRVDLALALAADAVHLGQTDLPLADARRVVRGRLKIGVSTHDLAQVIAARDGGADYLGYGPIFATSTKLNPDPVQGLGALREAARAAGVLPIVAIGGIRPSDAAAVYAAGAAAIAAIGAVNDAADVTAVARLFAMRHSE